MGHQDRDQRQRLNDVQPDREYDLGSFGVVNPIDILPVLALVFAIACVPLLSDGPPADR